MNFVAGVPSARGSYTYRLNGAEAGVTEAWAISLRPDGSRAIRSARSAHAYGTSIEVDAVEQDGVLTTFTVFWQNSSEGAVPQANARYSISDSQISVERLISGGPVLLSQMPAPPNLVVSPLLRIFQGPAIKRVAELGRGGRVPVLVPWILDPKDGERLLTPLIDYRSAARLGRACPAININGQRLAADRYTYLGGRYDDSAKFFLGEDGLLLRYVFHESESRKWDVRLSTLTFVTERITDGSRND